MNATIVIPTCGSYELLDKCLQGLYQNTDMSKLQVVVVCNGSDDVSSKLVMQNGLQLVWFKDAVGFTKAANAGLKLAERPVTIIMNTDSHLLHYWPQNRWYEVLVEPLQNPEISISGLTEMRSEWGNYIPFFFTAIKTELFSKIGYLDEDFSPGYGEDLDFCLRTKQAGYRIETIKDNEREDVENRMIIASYPIYHRGEQSFTQEQRNWCLQNAHDVMNRKWGPGEKARVA